MSFPFGLSRPKKCFFGLALYPLRDQSHCMATVLNESLFGFASTFGTYNAPFAHDRFPDELVLLLVWDGYPYSSLTDRADARHLHIWTQKRLASGNRTLAQWILYPSIQPVTAFLPEALALEANSKKSQRGPCRDERDY